MKDAKFGSKTSRSRKTKIGPQKPRGRGMRSVPSESYDESKLVGCTYFKTQKKKSHWSARLEGKTKRPCLEGGKIRCSVKLAQKQRQMLKVFKWIGTILTGVVIKSNKGEIREKRENETKLKKNDGKKNSARTDEINRGGLEIT